MKPKILDQKIACHSRFFAIEELHLQFANGETRHFERIKGRFSGAVMMLPVLDEDTILLVREYGAGVEDYFLGFPKGAIDEGESALATANRELKEEIGYGAKKMTPLKKMSGAPGYVSAEMQVFIAEELYPETAEGDEPEPIEVVPWKLSRIDELLAHPEFHEARSIAALLLYLRQRDER